MNARQLESVLVLAEEKSFSEAAKRLGISQPSLSQYIQKIEEECGNVLFERSIPLKLTYAGSVYVQHAKNIMRSHKQMEEILADVSAEDAGKLVIGAGPLNSMSFLPYVIQKYKEKYPKVKVVLEEHAERELELKEEEGIFDIVVTTRKINEKKFEYIPLFEEEILLTLREDDPFCKIHAEKKDGKYVVDAKDCLSLTFIEMDEFFPIQRTLTDLFAEYQVKPKYVVKCGSIMTAYALAKTGIGATLIPSGAVKYSEDQQMRYYSIVPKPGVRPFGAYYLKGKYTTKALLHFIEILKQSEKW